MYIFVIVGEAYIYMHKYVYNMYVDTYICM